MNRNRAQHDRPQPRVLRSHDTQPKGECGCCFTEHLSARMARCPSSEPHAFCGPCLSQYAATQLASQKPDIQCMHTGEKCNTVFTRKELSKFLTPKVMKLYDKLIQKREIEAANIENLVGCPNCDWACILETRMEDDTLFRCGNMVGGCGVVSCRMCKERDHSPLSCEEARRVNQATKDPRLAIEEAMTKALMRKCPQCDTAFIKEQGCNKMMCPTCKTQSCYLCRQTIRNYDHFRSDNPRHPASRSGTAKCLLYSTEPVDELHAQEVEEARKQATALLSQPRDLAPAPVERVVRAIQVDQLRNAQAQAPVQPVPPLNRLLQFLRPFQPIQPILPVEPVREQAIHPAAPPALVPPPNPEPAPHPVPDVQALRQEYERVKHQHHLARRRRKYAADQLAAQARRWSQARYDAVCEEVRRWEVDMDRARRALEAGEREVMRVGVRRIDRAVVVQRLVVQEAVVALNEGLGAHEGQEGDANEEEGDGGEEEPVVNVAALREESAAADHEYKKARDREKYAAKMWGMRHRLWSEARYEGVKAETVRYEREARVKRSAYAAALR
ncbi:hypothetical protein DFP72DRAFT_1162340 [Ephemerocybe angulata]|uniref:RING-type domain-containing protein n=1 Tax=Ephemerocybe angulata TaxID=980116 RepID=A0A8H6IGT1_9AGAR|nr:hypothetical protein DFP72DRAFT_1162340 [Tulosesus angulatus]